jgi:hypothetical protein
VPLVEAIGKAKVAQSRVHSATGVLETRAGPCIWITWSMILLERSARTPKGVLSATSCWQQSYSMTLSARTRNDSDWKRRLNRAANDGKPI